MSVLRASLATVTLLAVASAHDWDWGKCPSVRPMNNMDIDRFLGDWYVIEQFDTASSCVMLNYTRLSPTQLRVTKYRKLSQVGLGHNSYGGTLDIPKENTGKFRVKWPLNIAGKGDYFVLKTDYDNYAALYDCQQMTAFMHRHSASIISRTPTLDPTYISNVKRTLTSFKVSTKHFNKISHKNCRPGGNRDVHTHLDSDTIPTLIDNARDGIEGVATSIFNGVRDIAGSVTGQNPSSANRPPRPTTPASEDGVVNEAFIPVVEGSIDRTFNPDDNVRNAGRDDLPEGITPSDDAADERQATPIRTTTASSTTRRTTPTSTSTTSSTTTTTTTEAPLPDENIFDININNLPDVSINGIDSQDGSLDVNVYDVQEEEIIPVNDVLNTRVVSV